MPLRDYVIRRTIIIVPTFFLITIVIFTLIHLAPGDPTAIMGGPRGLPQPIRDAIRKEYGLDQPVYVQYFVWIGKLLRGDLGFSYINERSVWHMIVERIPLTLELLLTAEVVSIVIAVILGVIAAVKHHSITDATCSVGALVGYSTPDFWLAMILGLIFSSQLKLFPSTGPYSVGIPFASPFDAFIDHLRHLFLPAMTLIILWTAYLFRMVRSAMLEVLTHDYVTTARAKGVREWIVIYKHALRNAMLPIVTYVGNSVGFLLSGAAVIEYIFDWPGLGHLMVYRTELRDYPALMGLSIFIAIGVLVANLCSDIAYAMVDPRIRYD
jgi:peptide/nickel transport system permease protein